MAVIQQTANFPPNVVPPSAVGVPPPVPQRRNPYARQNTAAPAQAQSPNTGNVPFPGFVPSQQRDPRYDPNRLSTEDTPNADPLSPTTIVLNFLKQHGYPLTAENVRRTVEANARDPGVLGGNVASYTRGDTGGEVELRNAGPEGTSASPSSSRGRGLPVPPIPPGGATPPADRRDGSSSGPGGYIPLPDAGTPPVGMQPPGIFMPPPAEGAQVGGAPQPQMPPPDAGAAVAVPTPPDPIRDAITRAISGPPEVPALPAPPVRPQIAAPPEVPALPAPAPQLALPAPERPLALPAPETPRVPALPAPQPGLGNFSGEPQGEPGGRVRVGNVQPKIAPGPRVQGAPIQPGPIMERVPGAFRGAATGARVGSAAGPYGSLGGAILGGVEGGAPELLPYVMKNLHLR